MSSRSREEKTEESGVENEVEPQISDTTEFSRREKDTNKSDGEAEIENVALTDTTGVGRTRTARVQFDQDGSGRSVHESEDKVEVEESYSAGSGDHSNHSLARRLSRHSRYAVAKTVLAAVRRQIWCPFCRRKYMNYVQSLQISKFLCHQCRLFL